MTAIQRAWQEGLKSIICKSQWSDCSPYWRQNECLTENKMLLKASHVCLPRQTNLLNVTQQEKKKLCENLLEIVLFHDTSSYTCWGSDGLYHLTWNINPFKQPMAWQCGTWPHRVSKLQQDVLEKEHQTVPLSKPFKYLLLFNIWPWQRINLLKYWIHTPYKHIHL